MGRKKSRARPTGGRATHADSSDDELVRGDLDEHEMRDELDEFELARERALLGADGGRARAISAPATAAAAQVLAFDDDSGSDGDYEQPSLGRVDDDAADDEAMSAEAGDAAEEDGLAGGRGWGRRKAAYYSADYVDEDWRGATREDTLELAEMEEREARAIQRRLAQQLAEDDLEFGMATVQTPAPEAADSQTIKLDTSRLSKAEKLDLLKKENPELLPLIDEFRSRWTELSTVVDPVFRLVQQGKVPDGSGARYVAARQRLLLLYCLNISFYLGLRATRRPTASHPVMRRIAQYGKLLQLCAPADEVMAAEMARVSRLLADGVELRTVTSRLVSSAGSVASPAAAAKQLRLSKHRPAQKTAASSIDRELAALTMEIEALEKQKNRLAVAKEKEGPTFTELRQAGQARHNPLTPFRRKDRIEERYQEDDTARTEAEAGAAAATDPAPDEDGDDRKRSITYEMAKNKGLMPKRNRESRNPRVKHKEKFKRALKKRRSLVRLPKKELQKYGGEVFGIRMGTVKSVQIK